MIGRDLRRLEDAKATLDLVIHRLKHGPEELGPRAAKTATASTSKDLEKCVTRDYPLSLLMLQGITLPPF